MMRKPDATPSSILERIISSLPAAKHALNVTVVYQGLPSRKWASEVFQKLETMLGARVVRGTWWNLTDLGQPGVLAGAVSRAMRSDVILIAAPGSEGLPLPFYYWVNSWLPHRISAGAVVGLLAAPVPHNSESGRLRKYLRTVARRARMDLLIAERITDKQT